jgi:hypothetical protein
MSENRSNAVLHARLAMDANTGTQATAGEERSRNNRYLNVRSDNLYTERTLAYSPADHSTYAAEFAGIFTRT